MVRELLVYFGMMFTLLAITTGYRALSCSEVANVADRPTQFRVISGCYVEVDGRWIPRESWRGEYER